MVYAQFGRLINCRLLQVKFPLTGQIGRLLSFHPEFAIPPVAHRWRGKFRTIQNAPLEWPGPRTTASHYRLPHSLWCAIFPNKINLTKDISWQNSFRRLMSKYGRRCISPLKPTRYFKCKRRNKALYLFLRS